MKNDITTLDCHFITLLFESMADGVFTLDKHGHITFWNRAIEKITGYTAKEVIGKSCKLLSFNTCIESGCGTEFSECGIFKKGAVDGKECVLRNKKGNNVPILKSARLVKDDEGEILGVVETVTDLTEIYKARNMVKTVQAKLGERHVTDTIVANSHIMENVFTAINAAADSDATVLIQGESGTGKELVAASIHKGSARAEKPMVVVNCSALSESLMESELFGHIRGAFTGAIHDRKGRFEEAEGGTIFLDEISELSPYIQVKLLRVLQEREIERVGESIKRKIDIRVITAANKDLLEQVKGGLFREDLYYRLKVFPIQLPPLRERKEDIPLLIDRFIQDLNLKTGKRIKKASSDALRLIMDYNWPGNVRELENAIEHAFVLCKGQQIKPEDLPIELRQSTHIFTPPKKRQVSQQLTAERLIQLLTEFDGNKAEVGRQLGVSRTAVWKYMKKWDIPLDVGR